MDTFVLNNVVFFLGGMLVLSVVSVYSMISLLKDKQTKIESLEKENKNLQTKIEFLEKENKNLQVLVRVDPLTKLLNRRAFTEAAEQTLCLLYNGNGDKRQGNLPGVSLLFLDLDHFKSINDNHGHQVGDQVLKMVSDTINQALRETDIVCRWGGEEIVVLLPGVEQQHLVGVAEKIRLAVEKLKNNFQFNVTISIGCSFTTVQCDLDTLVDKADKALYQAKNNGRNQVVVAE